MATKGTASSSAAPLPARRRKRPSYLLARSPLISLLLGLNVEDPAAATSGADAGQKDDPCRTLLYEVHSGARPAHGCAADLHRRAAPSLRALNQPPHSRVTAAGAHAWEPAWLIKKLRSQSSYGKLDRDGLVHAAETMWRSTCMWLEPVGLARGCWCSRPRG